MKVVCQVLTLALLLAHTLAPCHADELPNDETVAIVPLPNAGFARPDPLNLASRSKIYRDSFRVPHIHGETDAATVFAFAYAQAEDNFWQVEDNYILGLGRYCEVHGPRGLSSDLLNRSFEIVPRAKAKYASLDPAVRELLDAFAAGLNLYLTNHPEVQPRLITRFEPWHALAFGRHVTAETCFRYTRLHNSFLPRTNPQIWSATGSNGWAIGPQRTKSRHAMLLVNPHLPSFGFSQMYEAQLHSGEGWSFSGAAIFGNPMMTLGHNEHLGWTLTTNEPDIADVWIETFDSATDPLKYRYGDSYRTAIEWTDTIRVKTTSGFKDREFKLRKTHHGPIVAEQGEGKFLSARIAGLEDGATLTQSIRLVRAQNLSEFKAALAMQQFPLMNFVYADREGNIGFIYNGIVPRRDSQFDWSKPVDGADPRTEWQGIHTLAELPQVHNPSDGYVQNCNSSPFTTCVEQNPLRSAYPKYMVEDANDDKRRAQRSRQLLGGMQNASLDEFATAAFDTTMFWAADQLPAYARQLEQLRGTNPDLAARVESYFKHLLEWDCRIIAESTAATLCAAWYDELYGTAYPAEKMLDRYATHPEQHWNALIVAANKLTATHGDWRVAWGEVFRVQRQPNMVDLLDLPYRDEQPSLPSLAGPGPMGVIFTQYYTPSIRVPFVRTLQRRYGVVGASYLAVYEFGDKVEGLSAVNFGTSSDATSPHYLDQANLLAGCRLKRELFDWQEVTSACQHAYRPGEEVR